METKYTKIKSLVKEQTGSASASVSNTSGLNLEVKILQDFANKIQTPLNKLDSQPDLDLGNTQLNPQKMNRIKDMQKGKKDLITAKVRRRKMKEDLKVLKEKVSLIRKKVDWVKWWTVKAK